MGNVSDQAANLLRARETFLTSGEPNGNDVRELILNSWRRSRFWGVHVDQGETPYRGDADVDGRLVVAARPVLDRLEREMADARMSVILTDEQAWVLDRRAGERSLNSYLDKVLLAPGFSYSEKHIGTNGIGTALEEKRPSHVFGHEHFVERLQTLSCAGAPIRDPLSGRVVGLVDVTCWRSEASPLMSALVKEAARDIEGRLFEQSCDRERALLQEFLATCRRTRRPVLSLSDDLVITNAGAAHLLDPDDHTILREKAVELTGVRHETISEVVLSRGQLARLRCRPVSSRSGLAGAIVEIHLTDGCMSIRGGAVPQPGAAALLGLAGRSSAWLRVCQEVHAHSAGRSWLLLIGEPGVGKAALAQAAHRRSFPEARLSVVDAADGRDDIERWLAELRARLREAVGTVLLRHLDQLGPVAMWKVAGILDEVGSGTAPWVVGTLVSPTSVGGEFQALVEHFAASVTVPPLRHRIGDVQDLVPALLERHAPKTAVECEPEVMQTLLRRNWPGNVAELEQVLRAALAHRRSGRIRLEDLPEDVHATSRRVLTPLEALERDAIARALIDSGGNRAEAAARLGISRATIYRKIRAYGIAIKGTTTATTGEHGRAGDSGPPDLKMRPP
jgi:transcriptional regulator of acetoin/glycerol metabolism